MPAEESRNKAFEMLSDFISLLNDEMNIICQLGITKDMLALALEWKIMRFHKKLFPDKGIVYFIQMLCLSYMHSKLFRGQWNGRKKCWAVNCIIHVS